MTLQKNIKDLISQVKDKKKLAIELSKVTGVKSGSIYSNWFFDEVREVPEVHEETVLKITQKWIRIQNQKSKIKNQIKNDFL